MNYTYIPNRVIDSDGIADGASIAFYQSGTTTLISIYSDPDYTTPLINPYIVSLGAVVPNIYWSYAGDVRVVVTTRKGEVIEDQDPYFPLEDITLRDDLASTDPGKGAAMIGMPLLDADAVPVNVEELLRAGSINAAEFGVSSSASASVNAAALQKAVDYARANACALILPAGEIKINGDVIVPPSAGTASDHLFVMKGQGSSKLRGTYLHFTSGSLIVEAVHHLEGFFVTSDDSDGVVVTPRYSPIAYPARSSMRDIRAERCAGSGIVMMDNWIYVMDNCYARYNKSWGVEGRAGAQFGISSNGWLILGGEFQGNGTRQGDPVGTNGGTERGTGGGMLLDGGIQITLVGSSIEGNIGDGLKLGEEVRGLALIGVYFEKNGSHYTNRDICNDPPSAPALGLYSVFILNSNFTPQEYSGTAQERAIELWDVASLKIVNPQFYSSSVSGVTTGYTSPPIYVRESIAGRTTGWVENPVMLWSGYGDTLTNETTAFGYPTEHLFSPDSVVLPSAADTESRTFIAPLSRQAAKGVKVEWLTRRVSGGSNGQQARMAARIRRGPTGTLFSSQAYNIPFAAVANAQKGQHTTSHPDLPSTLTAQGSAEVSIQRLGTHADDTLTADLYLLAVKITTYEGVVGVR